LSDEAKTRENAASSPQSDRPRDLGPLLVRLLCADDPAEAPARHFLAPLEEVAIGRGPSTSASITGKELRLFLRDPYASSKQTRLLRTSGVWSVRDEGSRNGTLIDGQRLQPREIRQLRGGELIESGHTFFLFRASALGEAARTFALAPGDESRDPRTLSPEWELELVRAEKLARTDHEILIEGESGVGKEVLARRLHEASGRTGALVGVNCAALAESLLDDELFGHVRGAFSGAQADRQGLIRAADQGTLLLDEVGDMPQALQAKLLRVLEDHRVRPLGSEKELAVDVRIIAATHRDLHELVAEGRFRHDLLARLGLLPIRVPAVRERREDLGLLVRAILRSLPNGLSRVRFELEALRRLLLHPWPLNVRELRRALLSAVDLAQGAPSEVVTVELHHLPQSLRERPELKRPQTARRVLSPDEEELSRRIRDLLAAHQGNVAAVARALGKPRTHVQRLMVRLGVDRRGPWARNDDTH
jgi:DNA-binding NtrC family response regulator